MDPFLYRPAAYSLRAVFAPADLSDARKLMLGLATQRTLYDAIYKSMHDPPFLAENAIERTFYCSRVRYCIS